MLEHWGSGTADNQIIKAFENSHSVMFMSEQYMDRGRELGVFQSDSTESPVINQLAFEALGQILLSKILEKRADGTLGDAAYFFNITNAWTHLAGAEEPKAWLTEGMKESPVFMAKAARGLVSYSLGTKVRRYTMRDRPEPELFDLDVLISSGETHLSRTDLTEDQRSIIAEIVRGSEKLKKGLSSELSSLENDDE